VLAGDAWNAPASRIAFHERVLAEIGRVPGVTHAALTLSLPIDGSNW